MPKYLVNHKYRSEVDGAQHGPWSPGDSVELLSAVAEWVNRDSPGTLSVLPEHQEEEKPAPVAREAAKPADRQQKRSPKTR